MPAFVLEDAGLVQVSGPDATTFLQSLVSQDLDAVEDGGGVRSLLLQPTGKLGTAFSALRVGDGWWLATDAGFGAALAGDLSRFLLRVQCDVTDASAGAARILVRGEGALDAVAAAAGQPVPSAQHAHAAAGGLRVVRADWPGHEGADLLGPRDLLERAGRALLAAGADLVAGDEWEALRVEAGVPRLGADLDETVIPQEALLDEGAVSFEKGCFLGQELVCRIHDRGHVNRLLRRLRFDGAAPAGAAVRHDGKDVGALTTAVAGAALGYVRREVEPGATVTLAWDGGETEAVVEAVAPLR